MYIVHDINKLRKFAVPEPANSKTANPSNAQNMVWRFVMLMIYGTWPIHSAS